jgi:crossover junction endodeoxyribonuclease RusA
MIDTNRKLRQWRDRAAEGLRQAAADNPGFDPGRPVRVEAEFVLRRPRLHCGTGRNAGTVKPGFLGTWPRRPDLDKLVRALGDAMTQSGLINDDSQIVVWVASKRWADDPDGAYVRVTVRQLAEATV